MQLGQVTPSNPLESSSSVHRTLMGMQVRNLGGSGWLDHWLVGWLAEKLIDKLNC